MCVSKREVRPGIDGIVDHIDTINELKHKTAALFSLLSSVTENHKYAVLTNEELGDLSWLLRDLVGEVYTAADGIYAIYRKEVLHASES